MRDAIRQLLSSVASNYQNQHWNRWKHHKTLMRHRNTSSKNQTHRVESKKITDSRDTFTNFSAAPGRRFTKFSAVLGRRFTKFSAALGRRFTNFFAALGRRLKEFPRPSDAAPDNMNAGAECLAGRQRPGSSRVQLVPHAGNTGYGD